MVECTRGADLAGTGEDENCEGGDKARVDGLRNNAQWMLLQGGLCGFKVSRSERFGTVRIVWYAYSVRCL